MFGSERTIGKPVVSDLREGKQTVLIHYARQLSSPSQWRIIERSLGNPKVSREDLKVVRTILEECGARAKVAVRASEYLQTAQQTTSTMAISTELKALLNDLAQFCVKRSS
jgi:geranylgeranyl diphosphate synthase type I